MPNPALSAAIKEAYASAPSDEVVLHTLEIRHSSFTTPIRVVRNYPNEQRWIDLGGEDVSAVLDGLEDDIRQRVGLVARLEADAPVDAGELVAWIALAFEFDLPDVDTIPVPEISITMDNVGREMSDALDLAVVSQEKIEVTYRPYLASDIDGPQMDPPITVMLSDVQATPLQVTGRARMLDIGNKAFPSRFYTAKEFPGLAR